MDLLVLRNLIFGAIIFLAVVLVVILGIYMWHEYIAVTKHQADEERRIAEREAELREYLHKPKPKDKQP